MPSTNAHDAAANQTLARVDPFPWITQWVRPQMEGAPLFDTHVHVFPEPALQDLAKLLPSFIPAALPRAFARNIPLRLARTRARIRSILNQVHDIQIALRHLPPAVQPALEWVGGAAAALSTGILGGPSDLLEEMTQYGVGKSLLIASPPFASNDFVLDLRDQNPGSFEAAVLLRPGTARAIPKLRKWIGRGASAIKIHLAMEGGDPTDRFYQQVLAQALDYRLPVILHTGCIHLPGLYKRPELGHAEVFEPWIRKWPEVPFILAHMNFHDPEKAIQMAESYPNVWLETSWQPLEIIEEAIRRVGSERILFGSDSPLLGSNMSVGLERFERGLALQTLKPSDVAQILGLNARKLFSVRPS